MPLYKTITVNKDTKVFIWKVEESLEWLSDGIKLNDASKERVEGMKSEIHQRGFLSIRHLMAEAGYMDADLFYDSDGKPHLKDGNKISITHSYGFTGIIVSNEAVGIDIEKQREKILRIANKFTPIQEYRTLANTEAVIRKLTIVWGAKEAIYKLCSTRGLGFLSHIYITDFDFDDGKTTGTVTYRDQKTSFKIDFFEFEGFTCVYTLRA